MSAQILIVAETPDTVTLDRPTFDRLMRNVSDA